jgi:hypothetical protein
MFIIEGFNPPEANIYKTHSIGIPSVALMWEALVLRVVLYLYQTEYEIINEMYKQSRIEELPMGNSPMKYALKSEAKFLILSMLGKFQNYS